MPPPMIMHKKIPKLLTILYSLFIIFQVFIFLNILSTPAHADSSMPDWSNFDYNFQIKIPGLDKLSSGGIKCSQSSDGAMSCSNSWIGQYINAIYKYSIGIIGILSAVVLMAGGLIWITAGGNSGRIQEAKSWITGSLVGLIIAFTSYTILYQISPALTKLNPIQVGVVPKVNITITTLPSGGISATRSDLKGVTFVGSALQYDLSALQPGNVRNLQMLSDKFGGIVVSSTIRPGTPNHGTGDSADIPVNGNGMDRISQIVQYYMANPSGVRMLIFQDPNTGRQYGILNGQITANGSPSGTPGSFSGNWSGHNDHIHLSFYN